MDLLALLGASATARVLSGSNWTTRAGTILADYAAGTADQAAVDGLYTTLSAWQSSQSVLFSAIQKIAQTTVIDMVNTDQALPQKTLQAALAYLITQMTNAGTSFNASVPSVGSQTAVGTPTGNAIVVASVKNGPGATLQYALAETLAITCTSDAQTGGATAGRETLQVKGQAPASSNFNYLWPLGSGSTLTASAVAGTSSNTAGNLLVNSDFPTYTNTNLPDNWAAQVGTVGTQIINGTSSNAYTTSGGSLEFAGDGATLTAVTQQFSTAASTGLGTGGTPAILVPEAPYAFNGWAKVSATPSAGVLRVALVDGSGTIIQDDAGTNNSATLALTSVSTSFVNFNAVFRLPRALPSTIKLQLKLSTAIDNAKNVFIGRCAFSPMTQLYAGGPYLAIFSGNTNLLAGDQWTLAISQTWGVFQKEFQRYFDLRGLGLQLPSATSSPTVGDALVL